MSTIAAPSSITFFTPPSKTKQRDRKGHLNKGRILPTENNQNNFEDPEDVPPAQHPIVDNKFLDCRSRLKGELLNDPAVLPVIRSLRKVCEDMAVGLSTPTSEQIYTICTEVAQALNRYIEVCRNNNSLSYALATLDHLPLLGETTDFVCTSITEIVKFLLMFSKARCLAAEGRYAEGELLIDRALIASRHIRAASPKRRFQITFPWILLQAKIYLAEEKFHALEKLLLSALAEAQPLMGVDTNILRLKKLLLIVQLSDWSYPFRDFDGFGQNSRSMKTVLDILDEVEASESEDDEVFALGLLEFWRYIHLEDSRSIRNKRSETSVREEFVSIRGRIKKLLEKPMIQTQSGARLRLCATRGLIQSHLIFLGPDKEGHLLRLLQQQEKLYKERYHEEDSISVQKNRLLEDTLCGLQNRFFLDLPLTVEGGFYAQVANESSPGFPLHVAFKDLLSREWPALPLPWETSEARDSHGVAVDWPAWT